MKRYKMILAYDGTCYAGWQVQPGMRTIQSECEKAILQVTGEEVRLHASGRTDTGVHARQQVAHFDLSEPLEPRRLLNGLNAVLDDDIRVMGLRQVAATFHARFSAVCKEYRYFIWNDRIVPPHLRLYRCSWSKPLHIDRMCAAAAMLVGEHDFSAFATSRGHGPEDMVRRITDLRIIRRGKEFVIIAASEGFLYKMVRSFAGYLLRVGEGAVPVEQTMEILQSCKRTARVPTADPRGLFLWKVIYR